MRKIIVSNLMSLDGFFAGPNGEIDWFLWSEETAQYARKLAESIDTILFGRVTYELMAGYWPTPAAAEEDAAIANFMNDSRKIAFSETLKKADWKNTTIMNEINRDGIIQLKKQPGRDIVIYGSGSLVGTFTQMDLIDDYRIFVNPVVLGSGKPMFKGIGDRRHLQLSDARTFSNGVVLLHYQAIRQG